MRKYCKAYYLKDLRQFSTWNSNSAEGDDLPDLTIVYLWDDFTVAKSPIISTEEIIWDTITPAWQEFCRTKLSFQIPDNLLYAYQQARE